MEETKLPGSPATLRPHHALCLLFFEGKGYSQDFIENMAAFLAESSQRVEVTMECDILCQACPHNQNRTCEDEAKVSLFDQRVLDLSSVAFQVDQPRSLSKLCQDVYDAILQQGLLAEVCGECEWAPLCQGKWQRGDFNRFLLQRDVARDQPPIITMTKFLEVL